MVKTKKTLAIIGFGLHARRIYYRILEEEKEEYDFIIIDLKSQKENIVSFLKNEKYLPAECIFIDSPKSKKCLDGKSKNILNNLILKYSIEGVIISTEPQYHVVYAEWALKNNISILMDKPISAHEEMSTSISQARKLMTDYNELEKLYSSKKNVLFSVVSQRRFHRGFQKVYGLIKEIYESTNCPITSIQICHADGQWRLPSEIIDIDYHSYNKGYGKCSHSGYHFLDILQFFLEATNGKEKKIDNFEVFSNFLKPLDFLSQINLKDYEKIFPGFSKENKYTEKEYQKKMKKYGEIDAFIDLSLKRRNRIITLASINLIHNSFSQRGNLIPNSNLYKGNGRVRHETYMIQQGPFQCIEIISLQGKEVKKEKNPKYSVGGEYHFDVHVFRNNQLNKDWKNYEKISIKNLGKNSMKDKSRGHQEDARRNATIEFLDFLNGKKKEKYISDFNSHRKSVQLMYAIYKSAVLKYKNKNPLVKMKYEK